MMSRLGLLELARRLLGRPARSTFKLPSSSSADLAIVGGSRGATDVKVVHLPESPGGRMASPRAQSQMTSVVLAGGWGYGNLGDEAILAGYLLDLPRHGLHGEVVSVVPSVTRRSLAGLGLADGHTWTILDESVRAIRGGRADRLLIVAGGGYLNGAWHAEIGGKLARLTAIAHESQVVGHAVQLHGLSGPGTRGPAAALITRGTWSVRDPGSALEAENLGFPGVPVIGDAISLIYPHVRAVAAPAPLTAGRVLVNLVDVPNRSDVAESEFPVDDWTLRCRALIEDVTAPVIGLALDEDDARFMVDALGIRVILPRTVRGLVSVLAGAAGLISTRMHPALLATMVGTPTWALPYTSKVRPTMSRLGLGDVVLPPGELVIRDTPAGRRTDFASEWATGYEVSSSWLVRAVRDHG